MSRATTITPKAPPAHQTPTVSSICKIAQLETTPKNGGGSAGAAALASSVAPSMNERSNSRRRKFDLARASPFKNYHSQLMAKYAKQAKNELLNQSADQPQAKVNRVLVSPPPVKKDDDHFSKQTGQGRPSSFVDHGAATQQLLSQLEKHGQSRHANAAGSQIVHNFNTNTSFQKIQNEKNPFFDNPARRPSVSPHRVPSNSSPKGRNVGNCLSQSNTVNNLKHTPERKGPALPNSMNTTPLRSDLDDIVNRIKQEASTATTYQSVGAKPTTNNVAPAVQKPQGQITFKSYLTIDQSGGPAKDPTPLPKSQPQSVLNDSRLHDSKPQSILNDSKNYATSPAATAERASRRSRSNRNKTKVDFAQGTTFTRPKTNTYHHRFKSSTFGKPKYTKGSQIFTNKIDQLLEKTKKEQRKASAQDDSSQDKDSATRKNRYADLFNSHQTRTTSLGPIPPDAFKTLPVSRHETSLEGKFGTIEEGQEICHSIPSPREIDDVRLTDNSVSVEQPEHTIPSRNSAENNMQSVRDQISEQMKKPKSDLSQARKTIQRASVSFQLENGKETADLVLENERMKTSLMILNQRLKDQTDTDEQIGKLKSKNRDLEEEIERLKKENQYIKSENSSLQTQVYSFQQSIDQTDYKIKNLNQDLEKSEEIRRQQRAENNLLNEKIVNIEEEYYTSKTIQLDLLEQLKKLEEQLQSSLGEIDKLVKFNKLLENNQAVYIAKKTDPVDIALSQFLNNYQDRDKLKILFIRESEGIYAFGQRRVHIKLEKNDQLLVRTGGGYKPIQDFVHQFTQSEVEKIERKDVVHKRTQSNKLTLQQPRILQNKSSRRGVDCSPISSPARPQSILTNSFDKSQSFSYMKQMAAKKRVKIK